ncbi:MAG: VanW family protein [Oscillospiraceae bacterium]
MAHHRQLYQKKGYGPGLTISNGRCTSDVGGGLCQLANLVHYLVLHSPLIVRELHHHTDALFPDHARRVPFGTGTSVYYNYVDYRFENTTDQPVQLCIWLDGDWLYGELRTTEIFPFRYRLLEEGHHFSHEDGAYFRNSCIYRRMIDRKTGEETRELLLVNHSRVMYDPALIPPDELEEKIYVS